MHVQRTGSNSILPTLAAQPTVQPYEFLQDLFTSGIAAPEACIENKLVTVDTARRAEARLIKEFTTFLTDHLPEKQKSQLLQLIDLNKILTTVDLYTLKTSVKYLRNQIVDLLKGLKPDDCRAIRSEGAGRAGP